MDKFYICKCNLSDVHQNDGGKRLILRESKCQNFLKQVTRICLFILALVPNTINSVVISKNHPTFSGDIILFMHYL